MTILFNGKYAQKMFRYICIKIVKNIFGSFDSDGRKIKQNSDSPYSQMNCEDYVSKDNNDNSPHIYAMLAVKL